MSDLYNDIQAVKLKSDVVKDQKVARFSYTNTAYQNDIAAGVENYDAPADQNVPLSTKTDLNDTVIDKGVRGQAASLPRNAINHFFGRMSYNLNKMHDWFNTVIDKLLRSMAMNGSRYTATTKYSQYDVVTFVDTTVTPPQVRYFFRNSTDPAELVGSAPMIAGVVQTAQWSEYSDVAARAHSYIRRDANGRAKVAAPSATDDIARKDTVDTHANLTNPHSATSAATADRLILRDANGRAKVAAPSATDDIARKAEVDALTPTGNVSHGFIEYLGATNVNWICPIGVTEVVLNGVGQGGHCGSGSTIVTSAGETAIAGGGSGAFCINLRKTVVPGQSYNIVLSTTGNSTFFGVTLGKGGNSSGWNAGITPGAGGIGSGGASNGYPGGAPANAYNGGGGGGIGGPGGSIATSPGTQVAGGGGGGSAGPGGNAFISSTETMYGSGGQALGGIFGSGGNGCRLITTSGTRHVSAAQDGGIGAGGGGGIWDSSSTTIYSPTARGGTSKAGGGAGGGLTVLASSQFFSADGGPPFLRIDW